MEGKTNLATVDEVIEARKQLSELIARREQRKDEILKDLSVIESDRTAEWLERELEQLVGDLAQMADELDKLRIVPFCNECAEDSHLESEYESMWERDE
jgi:predicted  nucleic acid-binding Zn-ribbon protein